MENGKLIEKKSEFHFIFKQEIDALWPVKNRKLSLNQKFRERSVPDYTYYEIGQSSQCTIGKGNVRAWVTYTRYTIDPMEGNRMKVTFENLSDPRGKIPKFMVDWASKSFPVSIIEGLRKEMLNSGRKSPSSRIIKEGLK